ncbi:hypothetical protein BJ138DRAFT_987658, partial [Hygrophoropsis aurantiaca]
MLVNKNDQPNQFPPEPPTRKMCKKIIRRFCEDSSPHRLEEDGCAVCGILARV